MKKAILGTTALVAASVLVAGNVSASEKIKLGVGGYMQSTYYYADYDDDQVLGVDRTADRFTQEGEVHFKGSTTLDNGIEFGVQVQLEAVEYTSDQVDETFIYVQGSFGRVVVGSENTAAYLMHYAAPSPVPMWGADSPNIAPIGKTNTTAATQFGDSDKITYFTPRFEGFQLGASYIPDGDSETGQHSVYDPTLGEDGLNRGFSVGANFVRKFGGVNVAFSAGYEKGSTSGSVAPIKSVAYAAAKAATARIQAVEASGDWVAATDDYREELGDNTLPDNTYVAAVAARGDIGDQAYGEFDEYNGRGYTAPVAASGYQSAQGTAASGTTAPVEFQEATEATAQILKVDAVSGYGFDKEDQTAYTFGTQIGYAGFKLGGGFAQLNDIDGIEDNDRKTWSVGLNYGQGPWSVGIDYSQSEDELNGADLGTLKNWTVGGKYALGPGVTAFGGVSLYENDLERGGVQGDSTVVFVGTALSF